MKIKFITLFIVFGMSLILSSCSEEFLDHPITQSVSEANIGAVLANNPSQIELFLGNAYRNLGSLDLYGRFMYYSLPAMAHEVDLDWTADLGWNEFAKNDITSVNSYVKTYYVKYYQIISTLNITLDLLEKMDKTKLSTDVAGQMTNYQGEALFLRAFCNFNLLQLYGEKGPAFSGKYPANKDAKGIVLMLKVATAETAYVGRSSVGECYEAIIADLKAAETLIGSSQIPANNKVRNPGSLDIDYVKNIGWAQKPAVKALLGKVYLYMNDHAKAKTEFETIIADSRFALDKPVNFTDYIQHSDNNSECIFSLQYYDYSGPADSYSGAPIHQINKIITNVPGAWLNTFTDARTAGRFGSDPRLYEATLYDIGWSKWSTSTTPPVWKTLNVTDAGFRYWPRKIIDFFDVSSPRDATKNVDMIRLGDVYLMYAEVALGLGDVNTATEYVNKVRRRAWGEANYNIPGTKGEDLSTVTLPVLQEERYKELFNENIRWFDLCRWGILQTELAKYPTTRAGVVTYNDKDYYLPMPETELNTNPLLKQSLDY